MGINEQRRLPGESQHKTNIDTSHCSTRTSHSCQIGISAYKQPLQWLKKSVTSALSQSKTSNCFCTVRLDGPDAYTLETLNWLFSCFKSNPQIEIEIGSRRIGTFASYQEIFKGSESPYLCQLDADDWLEENILSRCIQCLNRDTRAPFAYT